MTFKLNKLAAVAALAVGTLAASNAFAAAEGMAQSVRQLSNFGFYSYSGNNGAPLGPLLNTSNFTQFLVTDNASVSATLNGVNQQNSVPVAAPSPPTDLTQVCVGTCGFAENDYTHHAAPTTGTFSRSDQQLTGVVVGGIPQISPVTGLPTGSFETTPSTSSLLAEVQIQGNGSGSSVTSSGTGGSISFTLAAAGRIVIDFNALDYLYALVNPAVSMFASNSLGFRLTQNNVTVFSWIPDGSGLAFGGTILSEPCSLNAQITATALNLGVAQSFGCSGRFTALTNTLSAGAVYNLTFAETTTASGRVLVVPEPTSLALVGLALVGVGVATRRRAVKAA